MAVVEKTPLPMRKAPSLTLIVLPLHQRDGPAGDIEDSRAYFGDDAETAVPLGVIELEGVVVSLVWMIDDESV